MYEKPIIYGTDDVAEGIYLTSGCAQKGEWCVHNTDVCYHWSDKRNHITVSLSHSGEDVHQTQHLHIIFGQAVNVDKCDGGSLVGCGNGVTQVDVDLNDLSGCSKDWKGLEVSTACHDKCTITRAWITADC